MLVLGAVSVFIECCGEGTTPCEPCAGFQRHMMRSKHAKNLAVTHPATFFQMLMCNRRFTVSAKSSAIEF